MSNSRNTFLYSQIPVGVWDVLISFSDKHINAAISLILMVYIPELSFLSFGQMGNAFFLKLRLDFLSVNNGPYYAASNWARPGRTSQLAGHLTCPGQVLWPAHIALVPPGENSSFHPLECLIYSRLWIEWACWFGTSGIPLAQPRDMIIHARVRWELPAWPCAALTLGT